TAAGDALSAAPGRRPAAHRPLPSVRSAAWRAPRAEFPNGTQGHTLVIRMPLRRPSFLPRSRQRKLALLVLAVALPAMTLAGTGIWLTLRVARQVEAESARYDAYLAEKVIEAFERELVDQVRGALVSAEAVSRTGGSVEQIRGALATRAALFEAPQFVPLEALEGFSLVTVDGQLLIYGEDPSGHRDHPFAAMLLNGADGYAIGAGGWWFNPRSFLATNLRTVVIDRLPSSPRMYGGL